MVAKWSGVLSTTEPRNDIGIIKVRQGNINSEIAEFQIVQNNKPYNLTGLTVFFCASFGLNLVEKPAVVVNAAGGIIEYTFDDDSMQAVGRQKGYFSIKKEESKIDSTQEFEFQVESSLMTRSIDGKSYIYKLSTLIKVLDDFVKNGQKNFNVWFESVKEILYGVDPGGNILRELIEARKNSNGNIFTSLKERLDKNEQETTAQFQQTEHKKADVTYVDQSISRISGGAIKGTYTTLAALKQAYPEGAIGPFQIEEDGDRYIWDVNKLIWVSIGPYEPAEIGVGDVTTEKYADKSLTPIKASFLNGFPNLLDKFKGKANTNINPFTGTEVSIAGYYLSDYIPVKRNVQINLSKIRMLARYTVDKAIIPNSTVGEADFPTRQEYSFIPSNDGYIRATFRETDEFPEWTNGVVNEGVKLLKIDEVDRYSLDESIVVNKGSLPPEKPNLNLVKLVVIKNGDKTQIKYRYSDAENEIVEFNRLGINNIIHPKAFYRESSATLTDYFDNLSTRYTINTDWVSPYATLVADGGTTSFNGTVGGNHGTIGNSGHATARPVSEEYFLDGETIKDGSVLYGDEVKIVVNNYVSARNRINPDTGAKADSLLETVVYTITPNSIEVSVYCTANEPLNMGNYTGLQMTCALVPGGEVYFSEDTVGKFIDDGLRHESSALPYNGDRVVISNENDLVAVYTNREVGLGDLSHKGSTPIHFVNGNKMYSHLINPDNQVHLDTGESAYYSGGYSIMKPLQCSGAEKAYFIKVNGSKVYCVDFLKKSVNAYFKLPSNELGKAIEVLEKSETVSVDGIISGKGLKINSNGIGTLKFTIKT